MSAMTLLIRLLILLGMAASAWGQGAQAPTDPSKLDLDATALPTAAVRHAYKFQFQPRGGTPPFQWKFSGDLPTGMQLSDDGILSGVPESVGEWHFTIQVSDSSRPAQTVSRESTLHVMEPLMLQWKDYAAVNGDRIGGRLEVSNSTGDDFDFTVVVLAVNEIGKAFAIGYQHFPLKSGAESLEIPFGETLPQGKYVVHVDAVGEVPARHAIYRARLQTKEALSVTVGP
jgi:hypothetical protein